VERAFELASRGFALPALHEADRKLCRLAYLIARERIAGREPTIDLLFRVGLGAAVPHLPQPERDNVVRALRSLGRRTRWYKAV